jgi:hypothetical protein
MCDRCAFERDPDRLGDLERRQLPQPTEQSFGTAPDEHDLTPRLDPDQGAREERQVALFLARGHDRQLVLPTGAGGDAVVREGTHEAARRGRRADGRAELHQPLVEIAGRGRGRERRHQRAGVRPQRLSARGRFDVVLDGEHATEHAGDIAVDERCALPERDRRDRSCGVWPDARHAAQLGRGTRELALVAHGLRARPQISRARVVAEARPDLEHVIERRGRERRHRREPRHPALPVRDHGGDARLLQHDLADPDRVRIARAAPRQVPLHLRVVRDDGGRDHPGSFHRPLVARVS